MKLRRDNYDRSYFENFLFEEKANSTRNRNRLTEILSYKDRGALLEIGCGTGGFLKIAQEHFDIYGIDRSQYAVDSVKKSTDHPIPVDRMIVGNIEVLTLDPENYDVVAVFNVLEHLHHPELTVKNVYDSLKEGGVMIGSVPLNAALLGKIHTRLTNLFDQTHISTFSDRTWEKIFTRSGFGVVNLFGEVMFGSSRSIYVRNRYWRWLSLNLMFVCMKTV